MPQITNQKRLLRDFELELASVGPKDGRWKGEYLKCPICGYFVLKGRGYDECICSNISIDSDMLRVSVSVTSELEVEVYNAKKKTNGKG